MGKFPANNKAQLVVEAMIALTILITSVLVFVGLLSKSLGFNRVITDQYIGAYLAAEGIEVVKNLIDSNYLMTAPWNQGFSSSGDYEVSYNSVNLVNNSNRKICFNRDSGRYGYDECSYPNSQETSFSRIVSVDPIGNDQIRVNSVVRWKNRGVDYSINLEDHFYDWRNY